MKIDKQTFDLDEELSISINFEDNDGLIFIPKNVSIEIRIVRHNRSPLQVAPKDVFKATAIKPYGFWQLLRVYLKCDYPTSI